MLNICYFMTPHSQAAETIVLTERAIPSAGVTVPCRPLTARGLLAGGFGAVAAFHVAYEFCPPVILVFLVCMYQLAHAATRPHAMYSGWAMGLLIYAPQLAFFWNIFGFAALALWLVLGTWLSVYLVLQRFALAKLGPQLGALAAPFLWTGVEYFRSELYYLRFSWLNIGYAFSPLPQQALMPWLGMYGTGVSADALRCTRSGQANGHPTAKAPLAHGFGRNSCRCFSPWCIRQSPRRLAFTTQSCRRPARVCRRTNDHCRT